MSGDEMGSESFVKILSKALQENHTLTSAHLAIELFE